MSSDLFEHDAFISYRRSDGSAVARWLRGALLRYRLPKALRPGAEKTLSVYLDAVYERATDDFFERNIKPALERSRYLVVIVTPDAFKNRADGTANWVEREIETFTAMPQGDRVVVARVDGKVTDPLPARLLERFPQIEVVDLHDYSPWRFVVWPKWWRLRDELLKIIAPLYEIDAAAMPILRQEERNRRLKLAWVVSSASVLLLATMTSLAAWAYTQYRLAQRSSRAEHEAQVAALLKANAAAVPDVVQSMAPIQDDVRQKLREAWSRLRPLDSERLHSGVALVALSPTDVPAVKDQLYQAMLRTSDLQETLLLRRALRPYGGELRSATWGKAMAPNASPEERWHALIALAEFDSGSERWSSLRDYVAERLVEADPMEVGSLIEVFTPVRAQLIEPLTKIFLGVSHADKRSVAAGILAHYAADDPSTLAALAEDADPQQFGVILPLLQTQQNRERSTAVLIRDLNVAPARNGSGASADMQARRKAQALVALWRLGRDDLVPPFLRQRPDPSIRTYLIHTFGPYGAPADKLIARLMSARNTSERRALILSLGQLTRDQLPEQTRAAILPQLLAWYRRDGDPGIHGALDWLLRHGKRGDAARPIDWGQRRALERIDREMRGKPPGGRDWYVTPTGLPMAVIRGPVKFLMTSREKSGGAMIRKRIARTFAIGTKEVTVAQFFMAFKDGQRIQGVLPGSFEHLRRYSPDHDSPILGLSWFDAAMYCNWLSDQEGLHHCYHLWPNNEGVSLPTLDQPCYRLPTEAEWEYAARAGAVTDRFFGTSEAMLEQYAWYGKNSGDRAWPVGQLEPNDLGLFDVYGNAVEWTQDREGRWVAGALYNDPSLKKRQDWEDDVEDSLAYVNDESNRVLRGGSFDDRESLARSGDRNSVRPKIRMVHFGFRVVRTLSGGAAPR